jgi:hypothetical protein
MPERFMINEERHGQEGKQVQSREHAVRRHHQEAPSAHVEDADQTGNTENEAHRHAEDQEAEEREGDNQHRAQISTRSAAVTPSCA